jgi:hypothetical protein
MTTPHKGPHSGAEALFAKARGLPTEEGTVPIAGSTVVRAYEEPVPLEEDDQTSKVLSAITDTVIEEYGYDGLFLLLFDPRGDKGAQYGAGAITAVMPRGITQRDLAAMLRAIADQLEQEDGPLQRAGLIGEEEYRAGVTVKRRPHG